MKIIEYGEEDYKKTKVVALVYIDDDPMHAIVVFNGYIMLDGCVQLSSRSVDNFLECMKIAKNLSESRL